MRCTDIRQRRVRISEKIKEIQFRYQPKWSRKLTRKCDSGIMQGKHFIYVYRATFPVAIAGYSLFTFREKTTRSQFCDFLGII